jgi:hypothetical protein
MFTNGVHVNEGMVLTKVFIYTLFSNPNLKCNPYAKAIQQCLSM